MEQFALQNTRELLEFSRDRRKSIDDFINVFHERWDILELHRNNILEFSRFLTIKKITNWSDVTPSIVQSFIIMNQGTDGDAFEVSNWINSMKIFYEFLIKKNMVQQNLFLGTDIIPRYDIQEKLAPAKVCLRCGKELESKLAKYCKDCTLLARKESIKEWNTEHREQIRDAGRKWREHHPEKLKQYRLRYNLKHKDKLREQKRLWKQKNREKIQLQNKLWRLKHKDKIKEYQKKHKKQKNTIIEKQASTTVQGQISRKRSGFIMSGWCKGLRNASIHLLWMKRQKKREEKIKELESKFNCCWEDKFKEVFESYKHEDAAKILGLNYRTLFTWANHLKLRRLCAYCHKKLFIREGRFHPECQLKYEAEQNKSGIRELLRLINPATINVETLDLSNKEILSALKEILVVLPKRESLVIEQRYLNDNFKDRKTLEEIGNSLNLTRERIRQIENKAIERLQHPVKQKLITDKLASIIFKGKQDFESPLSNKITELQMELDELRRGFRLDSKNTPLSEIELSVRASNCLREANIKTLGELSSRSESEMLLIHNFGKKTLWELREVLHSFGMKFKDDSNFSATQFDKNKITVVRKKCLFENCNVTPNKGKYCSIHKNKKWKVRKKNKCMFVNCNVAPRKGKYCSKHKHARKNRIRNKCSFPNCDVVPRKGKYCSKHKNYSERKVIVKNKCLFVGCSIIPRKGKYCSVHKTAWRRKRVLELLKEGYPRANNENFIKESPGNNISSASLGLIEKYFVNNKNSIKNKRIILDFARFMNSSDINWNDVSAKDIEKFNDFWRNQGRSQLYISSNMSVIRNFFDFLQTQGVVKGNITRSIIVSAGRRHKKQYTIGELKEIHSRLHPRG